MSAIAQTAVPVNSLFPDRYDLGKSIIYQAIKDLKLNRIKAEKGQTAYLSFEDLAVLDSYIAVRKSSGTEAADSFAAAYVDSSTDSSTKLAAPETKLSTEGSTGPQSFFLEAIALVEEMFRRELIGPRPDALAPQRQLKEAEAEGWTLTTAQVREIVGVQSWNGGDRFGFSFARSGKIGAQTGWIVLKNNENGDPRSVEVV